MPVFETITAALGTLKGLTELVSSVSNAKIKTELNNKIIELQGSMIRVQQEMLEMQDKYEAVLRENKHLKEATVPRPKGKPKWGCYELEGEEGLFCPTCYDTKGQKIQTTRLNSRFRMCPICKVSLG